MEKLKRNKFLLSILLIGVMISATMLLSSCYTVYYFHTLAQKGYTIDRVIYTDDYEKYITGRTIAEDVGITSGASSGFWVLETGTANKFDMVLTTTPIEYEEDSTVKQGNYYPIGYSADMGYYIMQDTGEWVILNNSYIFSGLNGHYTPGGEYNCSNTDCEGYYDSWDGCMSCNRWNDGSWIVEEQKTDAEVIEYFDLCPACNSVVETDNNDGTYTYTTTTECTCKGVFFHDGTWTREYQNWLQINQEGVVSSFRFNELVIDGYDFGFLYDFMTTYDYDATYTGWEQFYNPSDFSHMFSDLPVEKITIKNVTGLGDRAVDLSSMFENCLNLKTVEFGNLFENCKPTNISRMFYNCPNLQNVDLTTLDTSEVTNMSEMFAIGTSKISLEERDAIVEDFINNVVVPEDEELNDGTIYTIDTFAEKVDVSKEYIYIMVAYYGKYNYPLSYSEITKGMYDVDFIEFYNAVQEDPTQFGMAAGTYDMPAVVDYVENTAAAYAINAVYDADFYANTDRDTYVNYVINNMIVPIENLQVGGEPYTIDTLATLWEQSREETLLDVIINSGLDIPFTYNEYCLAVMDMTLSETVDAVNADPTQFDLEPKSDGTPYTEEELMTLIDPYFEQEGMIVLTDEELVEYYTEKEVTPRGVLVLGGEGSKFVIKEGTNVFSIFGDYCYFATVVAPNEIGEGIELPLTKTFSYNDVDIVTKITSADGSRTFIYKEVIASEPEDNTPPSDPATDNNSGVDNNSNSNASGDKNDAKDGEIDAVTIATISVGSLAVLGVVALFFVKVFKKKKKPMTIKDQRL